MTINSSISTDLEKLGYGGPAGCIATGLHRQVISEGVATRQLLASESGALCVFALATGVVYTLPTPVKGMQFEFLATVSVTSNSYKVITKTPASEFLLGGVGAMSYTVAEGGDTFSADGTTIVAITEDGATKGGLIGDHFRVTALSSTQWLIEGTIVGAGTLATPFATS
jgi:hypothetical protein